MISVRRRAEKLSPQLTWKNVLGWRLLRHHLVIRAPRDAILKVIADIGGLHAQLMSSAELALWARVDNLESGAVLRALWTERKLVKTWAVRGTLHLLPSVDAPLWIAAMSTRRYYFEPLILRGYRITREELDRLATAVGQALDGRTMTRQELAREVAVLTGSPALGKKVRLGWGTLLKPAAYRGKLCFAPTTGPLARFTRTDQWLGGWRRDNAERSVLEIARRHLHTNGPTTPQELARWFGASRSEAVRIVGALGDEVTAVEVEGSSAWMLAEDVAQVAQTPRPRSVRLLPAFDQYVIAAPRDVPTVISPEFRPRVYRSQGWQSPTLIVQGRIEGIWRHQAKGKRLAVLIHPFGKVPAWVRRAGEDEAHRLAHFMGRGLELSWERQS